jgi:hypothetical protein
MKKIFKYIKLLILLILINQFIILISNDSLRNGMLKSNSDKQLNGIDFIEFNTNLELNWNFISQNGKKIGIIQLYIGSKVLISNLTMTEWYLYENK